VAVVLGKNVAEWVIQKIKSDGVDDQALFHLPAKKMDK
jgi:hypothetical protein